MGHPVQPSDRNIWRKGVININIVINVISMILKVAPGSGLPVMFFIYGGAFYSGTQVADYEDDDHDHNHDDDK